MIRCSCRDDKAWAVGKGLSRGIFYKNETTYSPVVALVLWDDDSSALTLGENVVVVRVTEAASSSHCVDVAADLSTRIFSSVFHLQVTENRKGEDRNFLIRNKSLGRS